ncbi:MAG: class I SAM-dependent methyltransferase [Acidimicrobiales bacterium]
MRQDEFIERRRQSFGEIAEDYDRFRPGPPEEAVAWLIAPQATDVLELGAGTGALTRLLVGRARVRAVEPDDRMRAVLAERVPQAEVVAGRAEEIPADDASYDTVIAASSWHWVDEARALPEVARVVRPGGMFSLLWSGPDRSVDWVSSLWAGGKVLSAEQKAAADDRRRERHIVQVEPGAPFSEPERRLLRWTISLTREELIGMAATFSIVITMSASERQEHLAAMGRFLDGHSELAGQEVIEVPMRCLCWRTLRH